MVRAQRVFRVLLFVAATCLVVNDCIRLVFSFDQRYLSSQLQDYSEQEENNESNAFSFLEEEAKHKDFVPFPRFEMVAEEGLEVFVTHLIADDQVRHLAYLPIFSPPPDMA
jgi:hypothetical protein